MKDKTAVICILARDCGKELKNNIPRIEALQAGIGKCVVFIVENDSIDDTKGVINEWKQRNEDINYLNCDGIFEQNNNKQKESTYLLGTSINRIERMSKCRNVYLEAIKRNKLKPDYVIIIDIDIYYFEPDSIISAIDNAPHDWSALFANGIVKEQSPFVTINRYHDLYALDVTGTNHDRTYFDVFVEYNNIEKKIRQEKYFPVYSAFGGIGIYKYESIAGMEYSAIPNSKSKYISCNTEHVSINYTLSKHGGKLYIVSDMLAIYGYNKLTLNVFAKVCFPRLFVKLLYKIMLNIKE
jgi:hypothetical protein